MSGGGAECGASGTIIAMISRLGNQPNDKQRPTGCFAAQVSDGAW
jgi:hypothetical protein